MALKQQLLAAVIEMYCKTLQNCTTGYAAISTYFNLTHLHKMYGKITPADLIKNITCFKVPFNPEMLIEFLHLKSKLL